MIIKVKAFMYIYSMGFSFFNTRFYTIRECKKMKAYKTILARSFSRHDQKKLGCGAFVGSLIIALSFCFVLKPYMGPSPTSNLRLPLGTVGGLKMLMTEEPTNPQQMEIKTKEVKPICELSDPRSDICEINGDIRIHGDSSTIFVASTDQIDILSSNNYSWTIRPYARKGDKEAMARVHNFTITASQEIPDCTQNHNVPAIVFSTGGYAGNHFHAFSDIAIPLYLTSREFNREVQFLISDKHTNWIGKFRAVVEKLSKYEIIDIDKEERVHCFSRVIVGLRHHKELRIDPSKSSYSMKDFRQFLRSSYSLKREMAIKLRDGEPKRPPRLLIISRRKSRAFMNIGEIAAVGRKLGFKIVLTEADSDLHRFSQLVNSCDVMMGVHGAGLTNIVFLPENAVFIQILPLGGLEWLGKTDYGDPAKEMKLRYLEYRISQNESSLIEQYPPDHHIFRDPYSISQQGWGPFKSVYMDKQNVKLDVKRFQATLLQALKLLHM